jgi:hypothetical protein
MTAPSNPEIEIEIEAEDLPLYPADAPFEEQRRAWVFSYLASSEIDGKILAENCQLLTEWLESGHQDKPGNIRRVK